MGDAKDIFGDEPESDVIQEQPSEDFVTTDSVVVDHKTTDDHDLIDVYTSTRHLKYPRPRVPATKAKANEKWGQIDYILHMLGNKDFSKSDLDPELIRAKVDAGVYGKRDASDLIAEMRYLPRLK